MKHFLLFLSAIILLFSANPIKAQDEETPVIPDVAMQQVVKRVVEWYFKPANRPRTIYVYSRGIKSKWLPKIKNIEFAVVDDDSMKEHDVYFFQQLRRKGKGFTIEFGYGDPNCSAMGDYWGFRIESAEVRLWQIASGWGMGCSSSAGSAIIICSANTVINLNAEELLIYFSHIRCFNRLV